MSNKNTEIDNFISSWKPKTLKRISFFVYFADPNGEKNFLVKSFCEKNLFAKNSQKKTGESFLNKKNQKSKKSKVNERKLSSLKFELKIFYFKGFLVILNISLQKMLNEFFQIKLKKSLSTKTAYFTHTVMLLIKESSSPKSFESRENLQKGIIKETRILLCRISLDIVLTGVKEDSKLIDFPSYEGMPIFKRI